MPETDVWRRVCEVFDAAVALEPNARAAFLDETCGDDLVVREEVESLLQSFDGTRTAELLAPIFDAPDAGTLALGERVGPYTLQRELGAGGMGVVYEATREDVGKTVALKLVRHGRLASPEHLRRFLMERRVLARLEHPNVARLLDAGVTASGLPYLVMEYVDGAPIDRWADARRLTIEERLRLFADVCDAVHCAHRHLVVHRDLKPSNIAVTGDGTVKLLDFGIAALLEDEGGDRRLTRTGFVMLTPEYASPEQVKGVPVTTASDIYALGLLLYELLTGARAFDAGSRPTPELLQAICEDEPVPPSEIVRRRQTAARADGTAEALTPAAVAERRRTTPERLHRALAGDLDTIVLKTLEKQPERRYLSARELRDDVERHLSGLPVRARASSAAYRARKFVMRHRTGVAAVATIFLAVAAGSIATAVQARRATAARAVAEQRFRDVRALAGSLVSDVYDAIDDLPGSLPVRATLVGRAVEHLDRLYRQSRDDPALTRDIAGAYVRLGLVQGNPTAANLGDLAAARRSFERALVIAGGLVAADSGDHVARRTMALAHEKMSDAEAWSGNLEQSVVHARLALAEWRHLAAAKPSSVGATRAVAMSHIKLGDVLGNPNLPNRSDRAGATAEYRQALALLAAVPSDSLQDWNTRRLVALIHERLGAMLDFAGQHREAIAEFGQTLAVREGLVRERNTSANALRDVAVTHQILCEAQLAAGDAGEALAHCGHAVALYESLRSSDPKNAQSIHDLALGGMSMHKVLVARGQAAGALAELERSVGLLRPLLVAQPDNVPAQRDLARALLWTSAIEASLGQRDRAAAAFDEGQRRFATLAAARPLAREDSLLLDRARGALGGR
jgi:eukaryotic-like serine/threonine-protein kinase